MIIHIVRQVLENNSPEVSFRSHISKDRNMKRPNTSNDNVKYLVLILMICFLFRIFIDKTERIDKITAKTL